jgi:hypothetical protein
MVLEAIDLDNGRISSADGKPVFSGDLAVVKGVRHVLSNGNRMTAVSFVMPSSDRLLVYFEYEKPTFLPKDHAKTKSEALLYRQGGEGLVLEEASSNGHTRILLEQQARRLRRWAAPACRIGNAATRATSRTGTAPASTSSR